MKNYEVTFIVDPVLSGDEIKQAAQTYQDMLEQEKCSIINVERMGLRQLAYPINKRSSGIYFCIEYSTPSGAFIPKMELAFRRDGRIMRFLSVKLDKYGVKYNDDKRNGLIGKKRDVEEQEVVPKVEETKTTPKVEKAPVAAKAAAASTPIVNSNEEE